MEINKKSTTILIYCPYMTKNDRTTINLDGGIIDDSVCKIICVSQSLTTLHWQILHYAKERNIEVSRVEYESMDYQYKKYVELADKVIFVFHKFSNHSICRYAWGMGKPCLVIQANRKPNIDEDSYKKVYKKEIWYYNETVKDRVVQRSKQTEECFEYAELQNPNRNFIKLSIWGTHRLFLWGTSFDWLKDTIESEYPHLLDNNKLGIELQYVYKEGDYKIDEVIWKFDGYTGLYKENERKSLRDLFEDLGSNPKWGIVHTYGDKFGDVMLLQCYVNDGFTPMVINETNQAKWDSAL